MWCISHDCKCQMQLLNFKCDVAMGTCHCNSESPYLRVSKCGLIDDWQTWADHRKCYFQVIAVCIGNKKKKSPPSKKKLEKKQNILSDMCLHLLFSINILRSGSSLPSLRFGATHLHTVKELKLQRGELAPALQTGTILIQTQTYILCSNKVKKTTKHYLTY